MKKLVTSQAYILSFQEINMIGGCRQYVFERKCFPILGVVYHHYIVDIKTKKIYPIFDFSKEDERAIDFNQPFACLDREFLQKMGIDVHLEIDECDQEMLMEKALETVAYIKQMEKEHNENKVVPYERFLQAHKKYRQKGKK